MDPEFDKWENFTLQQLLIVQNSDPWRIQCPLIPIY